MSTAHIVFKADLDTKQYDAGMSNMTTTAQRSAAIVKAEMLSAARATQQLSAAARQASASFSGTSKLANTAAAVSLQVQDIGVQMQAGAKATTIILQQGVQIASLFGPAGAIAAGISAIVVATYQWASGLGDVTKELDKATKRVAKETSANVSALESIQSNRDAEQVEIARQRGGDDAAEARKRELQFMREIEKIENDRNLSDVFKEEAISAAKARFEAEQTAREYKAIDAAAQNTVKAQRELAQMSLSPTQQMMGLAGEVGVLGGMTNRTQQQEESLAQKQLELAQLAKGLNEENQAAAKKAADEEQSAIEKRKKGFEELAKKQEEMNKTREKAAEIMGQIAELEKQGAIAQGKVRGQGLLGAADEFQKSPAQRASEREAAQRQERAERRAVSAEVDRQDRESRKKAGRELTQEERARARERAAADIAEAKKKPKTEAEITKESIKELVAQIGELLTK